MRFKQIVDDHPLFVIGAMLTASFLAGFASYRTILTVADIDTVRSGTYVLESDISKRYVDRFLYDRLMEDSAALGRELGDAALGKIRTSALEPTWINARSAILIFNGQGMLTARSIEDHENGNYAVVIDLALVDPDTRQSDDGEAIVLGRRQWDSITDGKPWRGLPGSRVLFRYNHDIFAVDVLAVESERAQVAVTLVLQRLRSLFARD